VPRKSHATAALLLALTTNAAPALAGVEPRQELERAMGEAQAARDRKDYAALLEASRRIAALAPRSTRALLGLARAEALNNHPAEALAALDRLARMGVVADVVADPDLKSVAAVPGFQSVIDKMRALETPVGRSGIAFTLSEQDLITEGIAYDPRSRAFFVSSVHRRKIVRVGPDGASRDFVTEGRDGLLSALSLAVDPAEGVLWAASAALPPMQGFRKEDEGRSFAAAFDLTTGKLVRKIGPPPGVAHAQFGDLTVGPSGTLYVSDPATGRVYALTKGASQFQVLVDAGTLGSPQGLAAAPDGRSLFVADYPQGIARIDLESRKVALLDGPDIALTGIDGLVLAGDSLVGIQNGIRPHKVLRLRLTPERDRIVEVSTIECGNPHFDEPTLGVVVGKDLYYVANSQWSHVRDDGTLDMPRLAKPVILKAPLDW
jgi:sugar lactone lactonase YvrE